MTEKMAFEAVVDVRGRERVTREVQIPAAASVIVFAAEQGIDVTLEISRGGRVLGRADNAIPRTGVQRAVLSGRDAQQFVITIAGKEHANANGRVALTAFAVPAARDRESCISIQRTLAAADASYAASQLPAQQSAGASDASALYKRAADSYAAAAHALESLGPSVLLAQARHAEAGVIINGLQDWMLASSRAESAAQIYEAIGDAYAQAQAQLIRAQAQIELATTPRAPAPGVDPSRSAAQALADVRAALKSLAAFHAGRGERYDEAWAHNEIAITYHQAVQYNDAIPEFRRALALFEELGETTRQVQVLQNMAVVEYELGRLSDAIDHYTQVTRLMRKEDDPLLYSNVLCNAGIANWASGNYDLSLRQLSEALPTFRALGNKFWEALALNTIGAVYDSLGERDRALGFYRQALTLRTVELAARGRVGSLQTIGNILREEGQPAEALRMHQEALALATRSFMRKRVSVHIARDLIALGRQDEAIEQLASALEEGAPEDQVERARALVVRGQYRTSRSQFGPAESDFRTALKIFESYEQTADELDAWVSLARSQRARGSVNEALGSVDEALALAEEVRQQTANPELRATLMEPARPAFDLRIAMLAQLYFARETSARERERIAKLALTTAEHARARALADFQSLDVTAPGVPPQLAARRQTIYKELAGRRFRLAAALDRGGAEDARVQAIRADIETLRRELDEIDSQVGAASAANRPNPKTTAAGLLDTRAPGKETALIEYWLGADDAFAWIVDADGVEMARLKSPRVVTDAARAFDRALRGVGGVPLGERLKRGKEVSDLLLAPLGERALARRTLVFVPDGTLHYLAFAALRLGTSEREQFLIETHDVALAPSVSMYLSREDRRSRTVPTRQMLLVADPVYQLSDARLAKVGQPAPVSESSLTSKLFSLFRGPSAEGEFARLPGSAHEAAAIAALLPAASVDRLEGFAATRERFLGAGLERYRFIHIATHAVADAEIPQASALILSRFDAQAHEIDSNVLAADFVPLQLNAQTVVLSACDTALGKNVAGEGLIGLRYVVLARGADSVVSSLWPIADQVTAQVMSRFYPLLLKGTDVDAALSAALRTMLKGPFSDPAWWGAFTLTARSARGASPATEQVSDARETRTTRTRRGP